MATKTQHTPGPWCVVGNLIQTVGKDHERQTIAQSREGAFSDAPNARLIAAAPEMLELLRGWLDGAQKENHAWLVDHAPSYTRALLARIEGA